MLMIAARARRVVPSVVLLASTACASVGASGTTSRPLRPTSDAGAEPDSLPRVTTQAPLPSASVPAGSLSGVVLGRFTGAPIEGARIVVTGTTRGALSDARGRFRVDSIPPGAWRLQVHRIGYTSEQVQAVLHPPSGHAMVFALAPSRRPLCATWVERRPLVRVRIRALADGTPTLSPTLRVRMGGRTHSGRVEIPSDTAPILGAVHDFESIAPMEVTVSAPGFHDWTQREVLPLPSGCGRYAVRELDAWLVPR